MPSTLTPTRSALPLRNLQEHLDATSGSSVARVGAAQFFTPPWFADAMASLCPGQVSTAIDLQAGSGALLHAFARLGAHPFGVEIDARCACFEPTAIASSSITTRRPRVAAGNCVRFAELWADLYPQLWFSHVGVNPPFSLRFKTADGAVDSTLWTWRAALRMAGSDRPDGRQGWGNGYFIANADTIERLGLDRSPQAWLYQRFPVGIFPDAKVAIGVIHFHVQHQKGPVRRVDHVSAEEAKVVAAVDTLDDELRAANTYRTACPLRT